MPVSNEPILTLKHLRSLKLCARGSKDVIVGLYGEDGWRKLVLEGVPVSEIPGEITHPDVRAAVELAIKEFEGEK